MTGPVVVVGAGVAGLAAAWSARARGREVTVVSAGAGASALGSGAVDDAPWEDLGRAARVYGVPPPARPLPPEILAFVEALDLWTVPPSRRPLLATAAGRLRPARGHDRALLDLGLLPEGALVMLPRADRPGWDADALAAALAADRAGGLVFRAVDLPVLRFDGEHRIADADLAARHDDEGRIGWLAARLREGLAAWPDAGAVLLGPWLGAAAPQAAALSKLAGLPVGEALVGVGSPAGQRFEAARDRLLASIGVARVRGRASRVEQSGGRLTVTTAGGEAIRADAVVLAIGGLAGGGVIYAPPEHGAGASLPPRGRVPFELSLEAEVVLSPGAGRMEVVASLQGPELDATAWPEGGRPGALETVGVRCEGVRAAAGITAAGDVVAGRPRTVLEAVASGIAAGSA